MNPCPQNNKRRSGWNFNIMSTRRLLFFAVGLFIFLGASFLLGANFNNIIELPTRIHKVTPVKEIKKFTIPEGFELRQIADLLSEKGLVDRARFMDCVENGDFSMYPFIKGIPKRPNRLEGYLFPDTYEVYADASEEDIIKKMLDRFSQIFDTTYQARAKEIGMNVDQVVILASMIEREAQLDDERPLVSAVFHNRLKSKQYPLLQSCATVEYVLPQRKAVLSIKDTKIDSPYNTYLHPGLPIGPIASPGQRSIYAALFPADVDYLFFVGNSDGSHIFSKTYEEHKSAMKKVK